MCSPVRASRLMKPGTTPAGSPPCQRHGSEIRSQTLLLRYKRRELRRTGWVGARYERRAGTGAADHARRAGTVAADHARRPGALAPAALAGQARSRSITSGDQGESAVMAGAAQAVPGQVGEGRVAINGHDQVRFGEDAAQDVDDAVGAADGEAVGVGPADGDCGGAQG